MAIPRSSGIMIIRIDSTGIRDYLGRAQIEFPKEMRRGMKRLAGIYAREYLAAMKRVGITRWTGRTFAMMNRQIANPTRINARAYGVIAPGSAISLDVVPTRFRTLRGKSSLQRWAKTKGARPRFLRGIGPAIKVHRHPWIQQGNTRARRKVKVVSQELIKTARRIRR